MGINLGPPPPSTFEEKYRVGDEVWYLPHMCHAFNCNQNNEYPWVIGMKQNLRLETNEETGERVTVEDLVELDEGRFHRQVLPGIVGFPEHRDKVVPLRPRKPWRAVVRRVREDGTLDLDIDSNVDGGGMITLHYDRVPIDESATVPHSCHAAAALGGTLLIAKGGN